MGKLIIENKTDLEMFEITPYIDEVLLNGKISNNNTQYCYATVFRESKIVVVSYRNKKSDRLVVLYDDRL